MQTVQSRDAIKNIPLSHRHFWYIPEQISSTIPVCDNGEQLVDISEAATLAGQKFVFSPVAPAEYGEKMYLRTSAAERLVHAAGVLRKKSNGTMVLKITDAFRPLELQRKYFKEIEQEIAAKEGLIGRALWERVTQFIADPALCPPHSTGGTVDLTIAYLDNGKEADMGIPINTLDDQSNTWHEGIVGEHKRNRQLLFSTMTDVGFVNLTTEWWHYSYGDGYWAAFNEQEYAIYGSIEKMPK